MKFSGPQSMFRYQSGRVIALGRVMLSSLFLLSIWLDQSAPARASAQIYALLFSYVLFSLALAALTWRNWWLDARLALPAHLVDIAVFTGIIFSSKGYSSPFFLFFILPLLSAAIRWSWRETMLTATALVLLYLAAGLLRAETPAFELQRFIIRSGDLALLSALLVWFGIHQQFARLFFGVDELDRHLGRDEGATFQALAFAMEAANARSGALLLRLGQEQLLSGISVTGDRLQRASAPRALTREPAPVILFDLPRDLALSSRKARRHCYDRASKQLESDLLRALGATQGLVAEVRADTHQGWLVLWELPDLSADFLEVGGELGRAAGAVLDHDALLSAMEEGAATRTRLSLARDVHDSVVQFLAGATFRVEAIIRRANVGGVEADLKELKRLLIEEQGEIRGFVSALRRERELELAEAVDELKALALRLGQQWSVDCHVRASNDDASIPIRLQLDLEHLLRESVANAVRHGGASRIDVELGVERERLRVEVTDNGSGFSGANGSLVEPWSIKERVDRAQGSLALSSAPGCTNLVITLPLAGAAA